MSDFGDFDFDDFKEMAANLQKAVDADIIQEVIDLSLKQSGEATLADIKETTPERTGTLRGDWRLNKTALNSVQISNNLEYAPFVENGHRKRNGTGWVQGRFMMKNSFNNMDEKLPALVERNLKLKLKEYGLL